MVKINWWRILFGSKTYFCHLKSVALIATFQIKEQKKKRMPWDPGSSEKRIKKKNNWKRGAMTWDNNPKEFILFEDVTERHFRRCYIKELHPHAAISQRWPSDWQTLKSRWQQLQAAGHHDSVAAPGGMCRKRKKKKTAWDAKRLILGM